MGLSFGYIETRGLIGAIEAADAMTKAARVRLVKTRKVGAALVTVIVEGELGACQAAVDAGKAAAARVGELVSALVIPHPYADTEWLTRGEEQTPEPPESLKPPEPAVPAAEKRKKAAVKKTARSVAEPAAAVDRIAELIASSGAEGISMQKLTGILSLSGREARIRIKQLMDEGSVERVQQTYYWIKKK